MKKTLSFATVLLCAIGVLSFASCTGGAKYDYTLKVWAPEAANALTVSQAKAWAEKIKETDGVSIGIDVKKVGEGDAATQMIADVQAGADLFFFAQDQTARLKNANCLQEIVDANLKSRLIAANDSTSITAAKVGDSLVAYPLTSDNGYFVYYDKAVFTDESKLLNLTDMISVVKAAGKKLYFNGGSGWYNAAFFMAFGATSTWVTDANGKFIDFTDNYSTAAGVKAMKAIYELVSDTAVYTDDSTASSAFAAGADGETLIAGACISGTWDYEAAKVALGNNLGCAPLPSVTVDGETKHLGSFSGCKLLGLKPQTDAVKGAYAASLAEYLTDGARQLERFNSLGWGPSNLAAQENEAVKASPALTALNEQNRYAMPQGQYPDGWWPLAGGLPVSLAKTDGSEKEIKKILQLYATGLEGLLDA